MLEITISIAKDLVGKIKLGVKNNLLNIFWLTTMLLPYFMYYVGQYVFLDRGKFAIGGEVFIPPVIYFLLYLIKEYANRIGKGTTIPVPAKRFTLEHEDGQVDVEYERVQELILYVDDLENWLEKKGLM